ncbi:hypothetical protein Pmani_002476 [Petrolisthes manimaculis]|uniref:Uncharacterized protein n=1 Tax=Petrolisthes manimaculis TaxID=1843537 RepID=A0AAE1QIF5_9EUCA|nr:hypothetical protein Pmani_002476 [Petrolisthes manimaculis]
MRRSEATLKLAVYTPPTEEEVGIVSCQQHQGIASRHYPPSLPNSTPTDIYLQFYTDAFRPFNDTIVCTLAYFLRLTLPIRWCTASLMDDITAEGQLTTLNLDTSNPSFLSVLKAEMRNTRPTPMRQTASRITYTPPGLRSATNLFLGMDDHCTPLQEPYTVPYVIISTVTILVAATPPYLIMRTPPSPLTPLLPTLSTLSHKYTPPSTSPPRSPPTLISPVTPTIDLISPLPQPKLTPPPVHLPLPTPLPDPIHPLPDLPCDNPTSHPIPH